MDRQKRKERQGEIKAVFWAYGLEIEICCPAHMLKFSYAILNLNGQCETEEST